MSWSKEERSEIINIEIGPDKNITRFIKEHGKALLVESEGKDVWVASSQIDNMDDIRQHLAHPSSESCEVDELIIPRWLAIENEWEDEDRD